MGEPDKIDLTAVEAVINDHIPSLSDEADDEMWRIYGTSDFDMADFAVRDCRCGLRIDGFYEYIDHLKAMLRKELSD